MKRYLGKRVLVTGAGGFIGSHLTQALLREGANVRAMVHYNSAGSRGNLVFLDPSELGQVEVYAGDLVDPFSVRKAVEGCEFVFHLGSLIAIPYSYHAPQSYVSTNVMGTLNVLQACRDAGVARVIHTSTSETYGTALYTPIDEKHPLQGQSPYSATKIGADKIAESFFLSFGTPVVTVRPFNTYGPRQSARAVIPTIISQLLSGAKELSLGSLSPVRDFNYVLDTVEGFQTLALCDDALGQVVNVGYGKGITIGELANLLIELTGAKDVRVREDAQRVRPEKSEVLQLLCDARKAHALGWKPRVDFKQGLSETVEFIRKNLHLYRPEVYNV